MPPFAPRAARPRRATAATLIIAALLMSWPVAGLIWPPAAAEPDPPPPPVSADKAILSEGVLLLEPEPGSARVRLLFLPDDAAAVERPSLPDRRRLTVTGAYSSGDRFGPEGFVLRRGEPVRPIPQGWDGVLVVTPEGGASVHDVSAVALGGDAFNLRDPDQRRTFLDEAEDLGLSAIQSHLLIKDGALDLRPVDNAPLFRRRLLFETVDGRLGVFDTSPAPLTLYDAAVALRQAVPGVRMALNLDMGAYDFCVWRSPGERRLCGFLSAPDRQALTNMIEIEIPAPLSAE